jgi:hypothetical protein
MEQYSPKDLRSGVPIVWVQCGHWKDEVWKSMCVLCQPEFVYHDGRSAAKGRLRSSSLVATSRQILGLRVAFSVPTTWVLAQWLGGRAKFP